MVKTWRQREEALIEQGVVDRDVLDAVRRATSPERHTSRVEEAKALLTQKYKEGAAVAAALDLEGCHGPFEMGGPGGASARVPGLESVPRHQQSSGPAWDAAVAAVRAGALSEGEWETDLLLGATTADDEDSDGDPAPQVVLVFKHGVGCLVDPQGVRASLGGRTLGRLVPWIRAQATRAALFASDPESGALGPWDHRLSVPAGTPSDWSAVLAEAESWRAVLALEAASNCAEAQGALDLSWALRPQQRFELISTLEIRARALLSPVLDS